MIRSLPGVHDWRWLAALLLLAFLHGLAYALIVPLWQSPDEPMLFEYSALTAQLGRVPTIDDTDPALSRAIAASLLDHDFYRYRLGETPAAPPQNLDAAHALMFMPRQVGGDPPLYFVAAAWALRAAASWDLAAQARLLRLLNVALLPLAVAATYLAAHLLVSGRNSTGDTTGLPYVPLAAAALVAFQPMFNFIGAMGGNDGPANWIGALATLALVWAVVRGMPPHALLISGVIVLAGMALKRSLLPFLLAWIVLALLGMLLTTFRRPLVILPATLLVIALCGGWLWMQFDRSSASGWYLAGAYTPALRSTTTGGHGLAVEAGDEIVQGLPALATAMLRSNLLRYGLTVQSDGPARGRLVVYNGEQRREEPFAVDGVAEAEMTAYISGYAPNVRLSIVADEGRFYADRIWARSVGLSGNLISNGDVEFPALQAFSPLGQLNRYLRISELHWSLQSGGALWGFPLQEWLPRLFGSFWGEFGWMEVRLVQGRIWGPALLLVVGGGLIAGAVALLRPPLPCARAAPAFLFGLLMIAPLPVVLNALVDPIRIQQGRYLLPILPVLALVLAFGYGAWLPPRLQRICFGAWMLFWAVLASAGLLLVWRHYYSG